MEHPSVTIIAPRLHPSIEPPASGTVDLEALLRAARDTGTAMEINAPRNAWT